MQASPDQTDLKPPRPGRWPLPLVLALMAHGLLVAALTWGVNWQQDAQPVAFEAELWSNVAQEAAPREVAPPPPPPKPEPKPEPKVEPKPTPPKPESKVEPEPSQAREAQIAIEKAQKKKEEEARKREEEKKVAAKKKAEEEKKKKAAQAERE
ncbi:MAG TPA: protein TolA, partial [Hydrogenophaga sp.]